MRVVVSESGFGRPDAIAREAAQTFAERRGLADQRVVVVPHTPVELHLVVADREARLRPGWIEPAWHAAFGEAERLRLSLLVAPPVGCASGASLDAALAALGSVVAFGGYRYPRALEIVCSGHAEAAFLTLKRYAHPVRH